MTYYDPQGKDKIFVFALSTCVHCRRAKDLLGDLGAGYGQVEVDNLNDEDMAEALEEMGKYNPAQTFPTIIIGKQVVVGYRPDDIRQAVDSLK